MAVNKRQGKGGVSYRVTVDYPADPITGKRRQRTETYRTKKEADAREREWLTDIERGTAVDGTKMTLGEYLTHWLAVIRTEVRGSTWVRHECEIRKHLIPGIGHIPMKKLTSLAIQNHYVSCATSLAPSTIRRSHAVLHKALDQAVLWGMVERNSAQGIVLPKDQHREMQIWEEDQVRTFLAATEDDPQAAMWRLAVLVGLRKGELLALQWNDIDLTRCQLHVRRTRTIDDHSRPIVNEPKTKAGRRTITLPTSCVTALKAHKHAQNLYRIAHRDIWHDENLVFPTADGSLQWPVMPVYALDKIIKHTDLPKIRFHDLRHTAATLMLLQAISPRVVQERLGHASLAMTLGLYSHVTLTMQEDAATKMDRMFG